MGRPAIRFCEKHKIEKTALLRSGYYKCRKCMSANIIARRLRVKLILIQEAGGKCSVCGYNKCTGALQFHHTDPSTKVFQLGGKTISMDRLREEAKKCELICANCHAEKHTK